MIYQFYGLFLKKNNTGRLFIMMKKSSDVVKEDREVLLDLDSRGEAQMTDSYGSLQNGSFIPPRYVRSVLFISSAAAGFSLYRSHTCQTKSTVCECVSVCVGP